MNNVQISGNISDQETTDDNFNDENESKFIYMPVKINHLSVAALIDSGSSINIVSQSFYNLIPDTCKSMIQPISEKIVLANNQCVNIIGKCNIKIQAAHGKYWIPTYVLNQSSHPLILGTNFLISKKIVLDFSQMSMSSKTVKVKSQKHFTIKPNTEILI